MLTTLLTFLENDSNQLVRIHIWTLQDSSPRKMFKMYIERLSGEFFEFS